MVDVNTWLVILKLFTVAAGFFIVYLGWRAFRAQRQKTLLWMTVGIATLTLGAIAEGLMLQGFGLDIDQAHIIESIVTLLGFVFLVYSLYAR
jgi:CHASE2 domain-containing sensor protein